MINPYIRRWARKLHGTTCQRYRTTAPAWMTSGMCARLDLRAARKGLELALGAQQLRRHTRRRAEFRIRAQVQPPIDTRRPAFMLKPAGFSGRNPALDVPAPGGHCHADLVLSDLSAQLRTEAAERPFRVRLPVSTMMAVGEGINARNTNELHRQLTRQAMVTLLRRGIRATVSSGIPLHPAASTMIRVAGQFLGEEIPALPAQSAAEVPAAEVPGEPRARSG
jgi:hypothetical protein